MFELVIADLRVLRAITTRPRSLYAVNVMFHVKRFETHTSVVIEGFGPLQIIII